MTKYDPHILANLRARKESALKSIYDAFFLPLCAYGSRFVTDDAAVADIVQELFIKLWDRNRDFPTIWALRSFLYLSVRNACLNHLRNSHDRKYIELSDALAGRNDEDDLPAVIEEEVHRMILAEVERLPYAMRRVFEMTLMDMSIPEIAQVLDLSENTVRNQRARSREILRTRLKDKFFLLFI